MNKNRKISNGVKKTDIILFLSIVLMVFSFTFYLPVAKAQVPVMEIAGNLMTDIMTTVEQTSSTVLDVVEEPMGIQDYIQKFADRYGMGIMKQAAIKLSNAITQKIVGGGGSGSAQFVQDWNAYLYTNPQKQTNTYMNSFFDQTTRGQQSKTASGVASGNYSSYMAAQAKQGLQGTTCDTTAIQNYASNPNQLFANGNMRGLMAYAQPCGNPYSYSAIAQNQQQTQLAKQQNIAQHTQTGGWLPKMQNGKISVPANLFSSAMQGSDQMGNNMIVNASTLQELATAMAFRTGASLMQYSFGGSSSSSKSSSSSNSSSSSSTTASKGYAFVQKAISGSSN